MNYFKIINPKSKKLKTSIHKNDVYISPHVKINMETTIMDKIPLNYTNTQLTDSKPRPKAGVIVGAILSLIWLAVMIAVSISVIMVFVDIWKVGDSSAPFPYNNGWAMFVVVIYSISLAMLFLGILFGLMSMFNVGIKQ